LETKLEAIAPTISFRLSRSHPADTQLWKESLRKPVPVTKQIIEEYKGEAVKTKRITGHNMKRTQTGLQGQVFVNQQDLKTKKNKFSNNGVKRQLGHTKEVKKVVKNSKRKRQSDDKDKRGGSKKKRLD